MSSKNEHSNDIIKWSEIDKRRFFGIGTGMYSALTLFLHPISVIKTRQQVLNANASAIPKSISTVNKSLKHQPSISSVIRDTLQTNNKGVPAFDKMRGLFRGVGIILCLAVPARTIYIGVLESSREGIHDTMNSIISQSYAGHEEAHVMIKPLVASVSGGVAGGIAAMSAQLIVVPMDIISQRQMVMSPSEFKRQGSSKKVFQNIMKVDGWRGLYKGFGLSVFSSLPTGSVWWATYEFCQHSLQPFFFSGETSAKMSQESTTRLVKKASVQIMSGLSAAIVAATLTQPLDVVKTILQVGLEEVKRGNIKGSHAPKERQHYTRVAKMVYSQSGYKGFFRGTLPRIMHMGLWGTILSSAYEYLRHISRKDYHLL